MALIEFVVVEHIKLDCEIAVDIISIRHSQFTSKYMCLCAGFNIIVLGGKVMVGCSFDKLSFQLAGLYMLRTFKAM